MARENQKLKTQQSLLDAIERLVAGTPKQKSLKTHKLNNQNVEIEAGLKTGALKHYDRVKKFIVVKKANPNAAWTDEGEFVCGSTAISIPNDTLLNDADEKIKDLKDKLAKERQSAVSYRTQCADIDEAMRRQLSLHHALTVALFNAIPKEDKDAALRAAESEAANIVYGNFSRQE